MSKDWLDTAADKYRRKNKILFTQDSECLGDLIDLIVLQKHRTIVMWAFEQAGKCIENLKDRYPDEKRPQEALIICRQWAEGKIKMPEAKKAILNAHAAAKTMKSDAGIALCHAVGQACSAVHVRTHALGLAFYELSAIVFEKGIDRCRDAVERRISEYIIRLKYWEENIDKEKHEWAGFLLDDAKQKQTVEKSNNL